MEPRFFERGIALDNDVYGRPRLALQWSRAFLSAELGEYEAALTQEWLLQWSRAFLSAEFLNFWTGPVRRA